MKILVTGGAGFIGSYTVDRLCESGYQVTVIDDLSNGHIEAVNDKATFIECDICNYEALLKVFKNESYDTVIHFAAYISAPESVSLPIEYFKVNTTGTLNVLEAMNETGVKKIIFSSTAAVYGLLDKGGPITEEDPVAPLSPYAESKLLAEKMIEWTAARYDIEYIMFRYFNVAGRLKRGEDYKNRKALIPAVMNAAMGNVKSLKIFGNDYNTKDGTTIRDYIHVDDLVDAHLLALVKLSKTNNGIYNLGNGAGFTILDVLKSAVTVTGKNISYVFAERRLGDPVVSVASSKKATKYLDWRPSRSILDIIKTEWSSINK